MTDHGGTAITSPEELDALVGQPTAAVRGKVRHTLHELDQAWLAAATLCFVATADAAGNVDVSPKGDPAGLLAIALDERTLAIPDRPGNRRVDGFRNILTNPHVGLIFVIPGRGDTLRINGTARIVRDAPYVSDLRVRNHVPQLVLEVRVEEVFHHCSKAFLRAGVWEPASWRPTAVPRRAVISQTLERPGDAIEALDTYYGPSYADSIYG